MWNNSSISKRTLCSTQLVCTIVNLCFFFLQKVDYVLVYSEAEPGKENDEEEKIKAEARETYEENLRKQGLLVEHVNSTGDQVCPALISMFILFDFQFILAKPG